MMTDKTGGMVMSCPDYDGSLKGAIALKKKLERNIVTMLIEFEDTTGLAISSLHLMHIYNEGGDKGVLTCEVDIDMRQSIKGVLLKDNDGGSYLAPQRSIGDSGYPVGPPSVPPDILRREGSIKRTKVI